MGIVSKVISTVRKIDGIYTMLEGAVKKIDEVYIFVEGKRHLVFPESTLIFEKTTAGAYEFIVPEKYNYVMVEYAGAAGGAARSGSGSGSIKRTNVITARSFSGIVGEMGENGGLTYTVAPAKGGVGYRNGADGEVGDTGSPGPSSTSGGGGGGSTSVVINGIVDEASGGGGGNYFAAGGAGGGLYGGARQANQNTAGNNATDPNQIGLNSGNGYVRIYGIAG